MELKLQSFTYSGEKVRVVLSNGKSHTGVIEKEPEGYGIYRSNESKVNGEAALALFSAHQVEDIQRSKESNIIFRLVALTDVLDQRGLVKEANMVDNLVKQAADFTSLDSIRSKEPLDERELQRALRLAIVSEHDAVHLYELIADITSNEKVKKVMQDVANEEKVHVGEFEKLLEMFDTEDKEFVEEGKQEVEEI